MRAKNDTARMITFRMEEPREAASARPGRSAAARRTPRAATPAAEASGGFLDRMREIRPDSAERLDSNRAKVELAHALRGLRKSRGLTQKDIEAATGMQQSTISRLESPKGPMPEMETVMRYIRACGSHMTIMLSPCAFSEVVAADSAPPFFTARAV